MKSAAISAFTMGIETYNALCMHALRAVLTVATFELG